MDGDPPVLLFQGRDERGTRSIWAARLADGRLRIEGQDLGPGVAAFGPGLSEYEWDWTVAAADVDRLAASLGAGPGDDPLEALRRWCQQTKGRDPGQHLRDAGFALEFWSRVGD